jgi:hypothetical protein
MYLITNTLMGMKNLQWVRTLFTPTKKSGSSIHPYALQYAEPIAHFALSTGAFSDPPVGSAALANFPGSQPYIPCLGL